MEYQAKLNEKYMPVLYYRSSFEGTSCIKLQDVATSSFISHCFTSASSPADIIFYNFSELDSKLSNKDFCQEFSFFNGFTPTPQPLHPLNSQNPLSMRKVFRRCSLTSFHEKM